MREKLINLKNWFLKGFWKNDDIQEDNQQDDESTRKAISESEAEPAVKNAFINAWKNIGDLAKSVFGYIYGEKAKSKNRGKGKIVKSDETIKMPERPIDTLGKVESEISEGIEK